jgi:glucose/mannose transport system permease protein
MPRHLARPTIYFVLVLLAVAYLVPLAVVALNSVRSTEDILQTSLIGLPRTLVWANFSRTWSSY